MQSYLLYHYEEWQKEGNKCSSRREWLNKEQYSNSIKQYAAIKQNKLHFYYYAGIITITMVLTEKAGS